MALISISEEQILDRLRFENPWWVNSQVDEYYTRMQRRLYFNLFEPLVKETDIRRAVVLMGPRRVGKTVMLLHTVQSLLDSKVNPLNIAFVSIDTPLYNGIGLEQLFTMCRKATGTTDPKGWYIFFDEIQYLKDWEVHLKSLVDSYPNTRFVVSGSAAAALKLKSNESGAGRFTDFMLPPLTFNEYIHLKNLNQLIVQPNDAIDYVLTNNITELNKHFIDYINFGGFPEVIFSEKIQSNPVRYIRSDIIDKVLLRDLPQLYGIRDIQELNSLFTAIAYNSGGEFSLEELSKRSGVQKNTLKRYIEYLEAAFLIKVVHKIANKPKKFQRATQFKIYLANPSLRSAMFNPITLTDPLIGNMVETAIYAQYFHAEDILLYYARWAKGEVDMVILNETDYTPIWALEIKWSNRFYEHPNELKSLIQFVKDNEVDIPTVTTIDKSGIVKVGVHEIEFVPASIYAYTVGRDLIEIKSTV